MTSSFVKPAKDINSSHDHERFRDYPVDDQANINIEADMYGFHTS